MASDKKKPPVERARVLEGLVHSLPADDKGREEFPTLSDLLSPRWRDGVCTRQGGTISVCIDGAGYRVRVTCPTEGVQTTIGVESLSTLLVELELKIANGGVFWGQTWERQKKSAPRLDDSV